MDTGASSNARTFLSILFSEASSASHILLQATNTLSKSVNSHKVMAFTTVCGLPLLIAYLGSKKNKKVKDSRSSSRTAMHDEKEMGNDQRRASICSVTSDTASDSSLLKKHTFSIPVTTEDFHYPSINIFHRKHSKAAKLSRNLPLLVFIHGLGGQIPQFRFLLEYFVHISHTLAIDLPGCGKSDFAPHNWEAYTTQSLSKLIATIVRRYLEEGQQVVLIGHSMGSGLAVSLASKGGYLSDICAGLVGICPKAIVSRKQRRQLNTAIMMGDMGFDILRAIDRRGGVDSKSVLRFVGSNASENVKKMQLRFNEQSRTPVWRRMASGLSLPTRNQWTRINCPVYLLGGAEDKVTPISELDTIYQWLVGDEKKPTLVDPSHESPSLLRTVKRCIIPNAGHSLIYECHHVVNGLVNDFLSHHVDEVLSLGWQLSFLKEDKWLLKNLEKWMKLQAVSPRIGRSPFRAMKTLRQTDEEHNPRNFSLKYPDVAHVIDISHEQPPYDHTTFASHVEYHKFATVSKIPPTPEEVADFIALVDSIRNQLDARSDGERLIACHCHYGFNRTGFFLCSYMIERLGYEVTEAIAAFKRARDPGIKHPHFIAELFERYDCPGLQRPSIS